MQIFLILIIHKPFLGSRDVPQKFGPDRFSRFDVYWIQTNRQLPGQTDKINLYIDGLMLFKCFKLGILLTMKCMVYNQSD